MKHQFVELLASIGKRPLMYSANGSLREVFFYVRGYCAGQLVYDLSPEVVAFDKGFQEHVNSIFHNKNTMKTWGDLISENCDDGEEIQLFSRIALEFLETHVK